MIAHQHNVLEAVLGHAVDHGFIDLLEELRSKGDTARHFGIDTTGRIDRERQHRRHQGITQLSRDHRGNCTSHERVPAKNRVRAALLGPAVIYKDRRFAVIVNRRVNLRIRHQLDFDLFLPRPCLSKANCNHQNKNANRARKFAHRDLLDSPE